MRQWWGLRSSSMVLCEADVRPGGSWRFVTTAEDGAEVPFTGVYREVTPPERLVYTEMYDVEPFNRTLVSVITVYPTKELRDFVLGTGMERGAAESYDRLAELLQRLA